MLLNKWQTTYNKSNKNIIRSSISAHSFVYPCWCKCVETFKIQSAWFNKGVFLGYFNLVCAAKPYLVHSSVLCFEKLLFRFWRLCPCLYIRTLHGIMIRIINSNENQLKMILNSTDIVKRHQRDKCCFDLCLLVKNKQVLLWSIFYMRKKSETL